MLSIKFEFEMTKILSLDLKDISKKKLPAFYKDVEKNESQCRDCRDVYYVNQIVSRLDIIIGKIGKGQVKIA